MYRNQVISIIQLLFRLNEKENKIGTSCESKELYIMSREGKNPYHRTFPLQPIASKLGYNAQLVQHSAQHNINLSSLSESPPTTMIAIL